LIQSFQNNKNKSMGKTKLKKTAKAFAKTGRKLGEVGLMAAHGDVYGVQQEGFKQLGKAIGKKNLVKAQNFGEKTMGKKNYQTTARVVKRGNRIGANAASTYLAYQRGDPVAAAKYGGATVEASVGSKALREAHSFVKQKVGAKKYDLAMNSYRGGRVGGTLAYKAGTLAKVDPDKTLDLVSASAGFGGAGAKSYKFVNKLTSDSSAEKKKAAVAPGSGRSVYPVSKSNAVGGGGKKPRF
jgi:hypothetical protein